MRKFLLSLLACGFSLPAYSVQTDCWIFPGTSGDYLTPPDVGHFRTGAFNPWNVFVIVNLDTLAQSGDGWLWESHRVSNDQPNHGGQFDDNSDQFAVTYNQAEQQGSVSVSASTWYLVSYVYEGNNGNIIQYVHTVPGGTLVDTDSAAPANSQFSDSQAQQVTFGSAWSGGSPTGEVDATMCLMGVLRDTELSSTDLQNYAQDPLNTGDAWVTTYGSSFELWYDDSAVDATVNAAGAPTLNGTVSLGTSNGPDIPTRGTARRRILFFGEDHLIPGVF